MTAFFKKTAAFKKRRRPFKKTSNSFGKDTPFVEKKKLLKKVSAYKLQKRIKLLTL